MLLQRAFEFGKIWAYVNHRHTFLNLQWRTLSGLDPGPKGRSEKPPDKKYSKEYLS